MKRSFISILFITIFAISCSAQWKNANRGAQILSFGVHDTSLFIGVVPEVTGEAMSSAGIYQTLAHGLASIMA